MIILLSPAKSLDYESEIPHSPITPPRFVNDTQDLVNLLRELNANDISKLMNVSEKIALLNQERFEDWTPEFNQENSRPSIYAFNGDVYTGLDAISLSKTQINFAQKSIRILSGLYGLLSPLDSLQAYRLEMGTRFTNQRGKNLYEFWGSQITDALNQDIQTTQSQALIQLASNEYSASVQLKNISAPVITPIFKDTKNGKLKIISFYAKKARGLMARYIIENKIKYPEDLKKFDVSGYQYVPELSTPNEWTFTRGEQ